MTPKLKAFLSATFPFLKPQDAPHVFKFVAHPNKTVRHNALAWLIESVGTNDMKKFDAAAKASGISVDTQK